VLVHINRPFNPGTPLWPDTPLVSRAHFLLPCFVGSSFYTLHAVCCWLPGLRNLPQQRCQVLEARRARLWVAPQARAATTRVAGVPTGVAQVPVVTRCHADDSHSL